MSNYYQIFDSKKKDLYVGVTSHYTKLPDAKKVYRQSRGEETEDDSILIEISNRGANEVEAVITFGVKEGEQFALALLNLCNSIKR
ncbi:hypothetical protein [Oceanobacillus rekensis]|uniref:hypothetical protein n=1 Tax=Oceanobacillus rekensis TaxID=937927 RepID=UPI000B436A69|nr:hypothetical protein [Oceanobacillus rekensis]